MNALQRLLPRTAHLLCQWHIAKNILGQCKRYFPVVSTLVDKNSPFDPDDWTTFSQRWNQLVRISQANEFESLWIKMQQEYSIKIFPLQYINATWILLKQHFVRAWTDQHLNFRTTATSRIESAHAALKRYLKVRTNVNLCGCELTITLAIYWRS